MYLCVLWMQSPACDLSDVLGWSPLLHLAHRDCLCRARGYDVYLLYKCALLRCSGYYSGTLFSASTRRLSS